MTNTQRIFGIGTVVIDHVVHLPRFPKADTKSSVEGHWRQVGGPVPVALSVAAFYGYVPTFLGRWGDDAEGAEILRVLQARGIDHDPSRSRAGWSSGFAQVWIESQSGTRTIAYSRGKFPLPDESDVQRHRVELQNCEILHLDGWAPKAALAAARIVKESGGTVVLDAGSKKPGMEGLMPLVDVLIASELFRKAMFGQADVSLGRLLDLGCKSAIVTQGERETIFFDGTREVRRPAIKTSVVDSNGAGDVFSGAILVSIAQGWDIEVGLQFANAVAGYTCSKQGNSAYPTAAELSELGFHPP